MSVLTDARQKVCYAIVEVGFADVATTAAEVPVLDLPQGATVVDIQLVVDTAFAGGTTHDLDIGDVTDPNRYTQTIAEIDAPGIPANPPAVSGFETTAAEPQISVTPTHTGGSPTSGAARLIVGYLEAGRHDENFGDGVEFAGSPA
jgi:methenyltetrahydromethanopterin cyclohydrolase